jgi:hypothetical protein
VERGLDLRPPIAPPRRTSAGAAAIVGGMLSLAPGPARGQTPDNAQAVLDPANHRPVAQTAPPENPILPEPFPTDADHPRTQPGDWQPPHYDEGFVLVTSSESAALPYRLRLNHVSQFRYTNTMAVDKFWTDHLGRVHEVLRRNDIQLTRDVFYFSGYVFNRRLDFNILLYTSSATLSATAAGYVGYVFDNAFALRVGFFSLPSVRSLTGTYPFFQALDRPMATNYMRPGFTQGVWANGEPFPGVNYIAMIGNSLNTLDIAATRIDQKFAYSGSVWYDLNNFAKPWNDFEYHESPALRVGTAFTYAREDRLSDLSTASPENNATFISDGLLLFETGSLTPGVTVQVANYLLWAIDAGIKYRGFAFNTEFYNRWLNDFEADGPLPLSSMHDWGFDASVGYFSIKGKLDTYARTSFVHGPFNTAVEAAPGVHFYPFGTRNVWLSAEVIWITRSPYQSVLYVYSSGQTGLLFPIQFLLRF